MPLTSQIAAYDPSWPAQYDSEVARLRPIFGPLAIEFHHIESTAVPGLAAKPEIDILAVVQTEALGKDCSNPLSEHGFRRGGDLSVGHQFYKRDVSGIRTHKLHVCVVRHDQIFRMLKFRDLLRTDEALRLEYQALKFHLERTNEAGIGEYLEKKAPFIAASLSTTNVSA